MILLCIQHINEYNIEQYHRTYIRYHEYIIEQLKIKPIDVKDNTYINLAKD